MSKRFLIAFDSIVGTEKYDSFTNAFCDALSSDKQEIFPVEAIEFVVSKEQIENALKKGAYDVLICFEKLQRISIGQGTVKVWMKEYPGLRIILIINNTRKSTGKMKGLFDRGYYDALYFKDFNPVELIRTVCQPRTKEEAWSYYGLESYSDVLPKDKRCLDGCERNVGDEEERKKDFEKAEGGRKEPFLSGKNKDAGMAGEQLQRGEFRWDKEEGDDVRSDPGEEDLYIHEMESSLPGEENSYVWPDEGVEGAEEPPYSDSSDRGIHEYEDEKTLQQSYQEEDGKEEIEQYAEKVLSYFTKEDIVKLRNLEMNLLSEQEFSSAIWEKIGEFGLSEEESEEVYRKSISHFFGYDVIESLLDDKEISDIRIMNPDTIRIKRLGVRQTVPVHFRSSDHYKSFVAHLASKNNIRIDDTHAVRTFTDTHHEKFFLRINITTEYISGTGLPYVHIRKTSRMKYSIEELVRAGMFGNDMMAYLLERVRNDGGIIICGKGGSGKSTLINTLIEYIPHSNSGLIIQENFELFSNTHPEMMEQNLMTDEEVNSDGELSYDLKTLAINGLLLDLDYYIIGEIKGGEALYFLNAWYTGHRCLTTLHSDTALHAMDKLVDYAMYESRYSKEELLKMVADRATVIYMKGFKICEIVEAAGWDEETKNIRYKKIFFKDKGGWIGKQRSEQKIVL